MARKNTAARALAQLRMKRMTAEERSAAAKLGAEGRNAKLTPDERQAIARKAGLAGAAARWGKKEGKKRE